MKNITITLPDELAHRAKVFAAEHNTSVSRYVGRLLADKLEEEQGYRGAMEVWQGRRPAVLNEPRLAYPKRNEIHER